MSFLSVLKSKIIWKHISIQIAIIIVILTLLYFWLNAYTYHGKSIVTPDFTNMTFEKAQYTAKLNNLKIVLSDSVHFINKPKGVVVAQFPEQKSKIKPNRTIYLIVNGKENEKVPMPDLRGISIRQAKANAELFGLKIGQISYVPDISTTVLKQLYNGKEIIPQTLIPKGAIIDLVIGKGESNEKSYVVCLIGKTLEEAKLLLSSASLNLGLILADTTIKLPKDSTKAFIWKQTPNCNYQLPIPLGSYIDIWITLNKDLLPENTNEINL